MHYEIASAGGGLDPAGWLSLDDQENNDPVGVGWEEAGGSGANVLAEVNLLSMTQLANGGSLRLGHAFTPGFAHDLTFLFTADDQVRRGPVKYVLTGDYNGNGVVDAADYVVWRRTLGQNVAFGSGADGDGDGVIGPGDYTAWRSSFSATLPPAAIGAANVSEPCMIGLIGSACMAGLMWRRRSPPSTGVMIELRMEIANLKGSSSHVSSNDRIGPSNNRTLLAPALGVHAGGGGYRGQSSGR